MNLTDLQRGTDIQNQIIKCKSKKAQIEANLFYIKTQKEKYKSDYLKTVGIEMRCFGDTSRMEIDANAINLLNFLQAELTETQQEIDKLKDEFSNL